MITDDLVAALPDGTVLTDRDVIEQYRQDWARDPDAGWPVAVVRATCTEDVQAVLRIASAQRVPVVPVAPALVCPVVRRPSRAASCSRSSACARSTSTRCRVLR